MLIRVKMRFIFSVMLIFSFFQVQAAPLCQDVFRDHFENEADFRNGHLSQIENSFPSKALQQYYKTVGSWGAPVPFHILNVDALLNVLASRTSVAGKLISFEKGIDFNLEQIHLKEYNSSFVVVETKKSSNKITGFVLKDVLGRWFEVPAKASRLPGRFDLDFSKFSFVPSERNNLNERREFLTAAYRAGPTSKMTSEELAQQLTNLQLSTSTNAEKTSGAKHDAYVAGIKKANGMLAELLVKGGAVTRETLEALNLWANDGINPYEWKGNAPMAGVMRGTNDRKVDVDGVLTAVDLTQFEVAQQWQVSVPGVVRINYFLPAAEVPAQMAALLIRINQLNERSLPMEVFSIYKEFIHIHPFADGNGRTGRMLLNFLLLKAHMPPSSIPAPSLFYRAEDALRKYVVRLEKDSSPTFDFKKMTSFKDVKDMTALAEAVKKEYGFSKVTLENLHGASGYIFVGVYKGRYIQFESTHFGAELSDSLHVMISRSRQIIDQQSAEALAKKIKPPTYAIYPELLEQTDNYHVLYQENYLHKEFFLKNNRPPKDSEPARIRSDALLLAKALIAKAQTATSDRQYFEAIMQTPRIADQVKSAEEVADRIMTITSSAHQKKIYEAMTQKASPEMKKSFVDIYNAFNSSKYDEFMVELTEQALILCRQSKECGPSQRTDIPDKFLALVVKTEGDQLGAVMETVSRYVGREPGRLFVQRIRRGSLLIDDGAPGNHGMLPHALQSLFIYRTIGAERAHQFFLDLTGWTYERMFDSNAAFTPIPSSRDITRRHYWTGVFKAGNRSEVSRMGVLVGEEGRYPGFLRSHRFELVAVEEIEVNLVNDGSVIRARYKDKEFTFNVDRDGVPDAKAEAIAAAVKLEVDGASR